VSGLPHLIPFINLFFNVIQLLQVVSVQMLLLVFIGINER